MDPAMVGLLVGTLVGVGNFVVLRLVASTIEKRNDAAKRAAGPSKKVVDKVEVDKSVGMLRLVALLDIPFFAVAGYFIWPLVVGNA